jgi:hypothetical protein
MARGGFLKNFGGGEFSNFGGKNSPPEVPRINTDNIPSLDPTTVSNLLNSATKLARNNK